MWLHKGSVKDSGKNPSIYHKSNLYSYVAKSSKLPRYQFSILLCNWKHFSGSRLTRTSYAHLCCPGLHAQAEKWLLARGLKPLPWWWLLRSFDATVEWFSYRQPKPADVFVGHHPDTAASLVLQVCHSGTNTDQKTKLTMQQVKCFSGLTTRQVWMRGGSEQ